MPSENFRKILMYKFTAAQQRKRSSGWCFPYFYYCRQQLSGAVPLSNFRYLYHLGRIFLSFIFLYRPDRAHFRRAVGETDYFLGDVPCPAALLRLLVLFHEGNWTGWASLTEFNTFVGRIALASFSAYALGQILDIFVFNRLRRLKSWWVAPTASTVVGNALDTLVFFAVAFYASNDEFMAANWRGIAFVDYLFKLAICTLFFLPAYGIVLSILTKKADFLKRLSRNARISFSQISSR